MQAAQNCSLSVSDLCVSYAPKKPILKNINLSVESGIFYGLIGLNGAGKTTLIKTILGLRRQSEGAIAIFGSHHLDSENKKNIAFLPERFDPPWFLTGLEFLKFSTGLYGHAYADTVFYEAAESLALDQKALSQKVQTYSKGMRQKLGLLATILTDCSLLILDEPMSGLDPKARTLVKDMLLKTKLSGKTIFFTSHILADMDEICDRIGIINKGEFLFDGTPDALKKKVKNNNLERAFLDFIKTGNDI